MRAFRTVLLLGAGLLLLAALGCRRTAAAGRSGTGPECKPSAASEALAATSETEPLAARPDSGHAAPAPDVPAAGFDLGELREFSDSDMPSPQRLAGLLAYLRREIESPRSATLGIGGGPIDSGYVRGVIVAKMGRSVSAPDLAMARRSETNRTVRECLTVAQGMAGDHSVIPRLIRILARHPEGFLRQKAAMALAEFKDPSTKAALHAALKDRYTRLEFPGVGPPRALKVYPVRQAAAQGLRALGEPVDPEVWADTRPEVDIAQRICWLFEDKQPGVCLSAVQLLEQYGEEGIPYLKSFVEQNEADEALREALEAAKAIVEAAESPPAQPAPQ